MWGKGLSVWELRSSQIIVISKAFDVMKEEKIVPIQKQAGKGLNEIITKTFNRFAVYEVPHRPNGQTFRFFGTRIVNLNTSFNLQHRIVLYMFERT